MIKALKTVGRYIMLMGRTFARPERMRMSVSYTHLTLPTKA